jgi:hypothetical protein
LSQEGAEAIAEENVMRKVAVIGALAMLLKATRPVVLA